MFRGHDDPIADFRLGNSGKRRRKIDDELAVGMGDNRQVRVRTLGYFRLQLEADLVLGLVLFVVHVAKLIKCLHNSGNPFKFVDNQMR